MNLGYDALNQPVSGYNGASFSYDNAGRMTAANLSGLALGFTWDALNRQITQTSPQGTITRQFDLNGNRTQLKYPDGYFANYAFDAVGELTAISDPSSTTLMNLAYDNLGRPSSISRYQGPSESLGYGSDLRLSSLGYSFADTSKNVTFSYTYNLAGQPVSATASNAAYRNTSARVAAAYASDGLNRYSAVGASSLTYDGRSNLSSTGLQSFGYDGLNRMTSTTGTTLVYDALDRLNQVVSGAGTKFLYEGQQIIAEYTGSGALQRRYIPGPGLDNPYVWFEGTGTASSTARWLLGNAFGSIIAVGSTGAANTTLGINAYDEFGVGPTTNLGRFQYKGMAMIPELGLYHARARTYSQYLGRFMQPDPSGYSDGMNLYAFVHNGPVGSSDPRGLGCFSYQMQIPHPPIAVEGPNGELSFVAFPYGDQLHTVCYDGPNSFPTIGQPGGGGGDHQTPPPPPPPQKPPQQPPTPPRTCRLAGAGTIAAGTAGAGGLGAFGGALSGAAYGIAELSGALATASTLGGLYGAIGGAAAISDVAGFAIVGAVTAGAGGIVIGLVAVGAGVYLYNQYQTHYGGCSSS